MSRRKLRLKYEVFTQLPEGFFRYKIAKKNKKYVLLERHFVESLRSLEKNAYLSVWQDTLEVLKVETPKTKNKNIIENFIKKQLLETFGSIKDLTVKYQLSGEGNLNKVFNVYTLPETLFYQTIPNKKNQYRVSTFTLTPLALVFYNISLKVPSVLHFYINQNDFMAVFTVNNAVEFVRTTQLPSESRNTVALENIILTLRYVSSNIQIPQIVLLSGDRDLFKDIADDLKSGVNVPICELNYNIYFEDNFQDLILPVGLINTPDVYNFIPEKIKQEKLLRNVYLAGSTLLAGINIMLFFNLYSHVSKVLDKYYSIKNLQQQNQLLQRNIEFKTKDKDLNYLLTIYNLNQEKNNSVKGLNSILNIQPFFTKPYEKLSYKFDQGKAHITFSYVKTFKTLKEVEVYADKIKDDKVSIQKDYAQKTVKVILKYGD